MSDSGRKVIHTDVDTGLCVVNDSGDEQDDEVTFASFITVRIDVDTNPWAGLISGLGHCEWGDCLD